MSIFRYLIAFFYKCGVLFIAIIKLGRCMQTSGVMIILRHYAGDADKFGTVYAHHVYYTSEKSRADYSSRCYSSRYSVAR